MNPFIPRFEGEMELSAVPEDFVDRIRRRVDEGLLIRGSRRRSDYRVRSASRDEITFGAQGVWTAINVGLNEVAIKRATPTRIVYQVSYWTWTGYAVLLGAVIGVVLVGAYFLSPVVGLQTQMPRNGLYIFGGMVFFWCVAWPWILTAIHKRFAARCLERILREELEAGSVNNGHCERVDG